MVKYPNLLNLGGLCMSTLQGVNSVDIAVSILNYIAQNGGIARAADISKGCEISKVGYINILFHYAVHKCCIKTFKLAVMA
ncbi:Uncharacterised protein [Providencia rettgeri]|nr:Uncharacterised protein [Providencia rettgeri]